MADTRYACVRTDNMTGTVVGSHLVSLRYTDDIENGSLLVIGDYEDNTREVRAAGIPGAATPRDRLALIASEEVVKEVAVNDLFEFINKAGRIMRGYRFAANDIFSVTEEALSEDSAEPEIGQTASISNGSKMRLGAAAAGTTIGTVIAVEPDGWIVIEVR